jgi:hypothetical protein
MHPLSDLDFWRLYFIPDSEHPSPFSDAQHGWLHRWIGTPQHLTALLGLDLLPSISFHAALTTSALPMPTLHATSDTPPFLVVHLTFFWIHHIVFQTTFWFTASLPLNSNHLDITNGAKHHWNSISPARQVRIIRKYKELVQLLCAIHELFVPAFLNTDEMGDFADDIVTMFDWSDSIA